MPTYVEKLVVIIVFSAFLSPRQYLIASLFRWHGWDVKIIAWDRSLHGNARAPDGFEKDTIFIHIPCVSASTKLFIKLPAFLSKVKILLNSFKSESLMVIITHMMCLPLLNTCKTNRILYDASEMYVENLSDYFPRLIKWIPKITLSAIENYYINRVERVITVDSKNNFLANRYLRWNDNVHVIWNVPSKCQEPDPELIKEAKKRYKDRRVVAFVGGLMAEKGLFVAIQAARRVCSKYDDVLFLFIGPMKENSNHIDNVVRSEGLQKNVVFKNQMPYSTMLAYLRCSHVGLALYHKEKHYELISAGNGRKIFTYMQAGIPIIAPNFGEAGMAVRLAKCGLLVDTQDPEDVASSIYYLLKNQKEAQRLGDNGRHAFLNEFNWETESLKLMSIFK